MSRNSKNARNHELARSFKRAKYDGKQSVSTGNKGPARTEPKHGKNRAWFQLFDSHGAYADSLKKKGPKKKDTRESDEPSTAAA